MQRGTLGPRARTLRCDDLAALLLPPDAARAPPGLGELQRWAVSAVVLAAARFVFSLLSDRAPRRFWVYGGAILALLVAAVPFPEVFPLPSTVLGLTVTLDILATLGLRWRRLERGAWIVGLGAGLFTLGGFAQLGLDLVAGDALGNALNPYLWGGLALLLSSSIYLARTFARIRRELERRLVEVQELSARALAQEQAAREEEVRRRLLEAENERKGRELEEARGLQLAMLPRELPQVAGYELAAAMLTATEVGGDYYDAAAAGDGAWLAVGDAVGHGARAGTLVTVAKSLFTGIAAETSPAAALGRFDAALSGMGLKRAHLALTLARLTPGALEVAAAGMPPVLVRRAGGAVEEVAFSTLPLGAPLAKRYTAERLELAPGDLVVLLTDGLAELPGPDGGPLGYEAVREALARAEPPEGEPLRSWIDRFLGGLVTTPPLPDDVTLLALRAR